MHFAAPAFGGELKLHDASRPAMGTRFRLTFYAPDGKAETAAEAAFARIAKLERVCSDYLPDSELTTLNRTTTHHASKDLFEVIAQAQQVSKLTDGAFDITAGHYTQLWRRAKRKKELPTAEQLAKVKPLVGWNLVQLDHVGGNITLTKPGLQLDLGGIAKGYAANEALSVLKQHGITAAIVSASGDLAIGDPPPDQPEGWPVKLRTFEAPEDEDFLIELRLSRCGVSTSGDLHQFIEINGQRYSHIIDPKTGLGLTTRISATVIAPDATTSDAFATAVCIQGPDEALAMARNLGNLRMRIVTIDKDVPNARTTANWPPSN